MTKNLFAGYSVILGKIGIFEYPYLIAFYLVFVPRI
jgi:hypothetical protein